jgi:hypothetical protein
MARLLGSPGGGYVLLPTMDDSLNIPMFSTLVEAILWWTTYMKTKDVNAANELKQETRNINLKNIIKKGLESGDILDIEENEDGWAIIYEGDVDDFLELTDDVYTIYEYIMAGGKEEDLILSNLLSKIAKLERELTICKNMVDYAPVGKGYEETAKSYTEKVKKQSPARKTTKKSPPKKAVTKTVKRKSPAKKVAKK